MCIPSSGQKRKEKKDYTPGYTCIMLYISMKNKTFRQLIRLPMYAM